MPVDNRFVVIFSGATIEIGRFTVAVSCGLVASFTVIAGVLTPNTVGVPVIAPVEALMERPVGRFTADQT